MLSCWAADTGAGALARCLEQTEKRGKHRQIAMHDVARSSGSAFSCATYIQLHCYLLRYVQSTTFLFAALHDLLLAKVCCAGKICAVAGQ